MRQRFDQSKSEFNRELGLRIKDGRERAGLSQTKFGELIGRTKGAIREYEAGNSVPSAYVVYNIAKVLNISTDSLLGVELHRKEEYSNKIVEYSDKKFSLLVKKKRKERRIKVADLAKRVGSSKSQFYNYESGKTAIPTEKAVLICNELGIEFEQFIRKHGDKK